ncbi:MAG: Txe/YoeB family addiction module toxin [Lachnospiraceae bacterium]|nr:Txe/YoeB family addiction module toxin [Lachnospiraceae bacterium]MBO5176745.1 Txe/YoeB family addiction module toxin [Lachnospiraceae bacterium]
MYRIVFTKQALKDLENLKKIGISNKAKVLVDVVRENPYQNPPRYEKLVGKLDGIFSRRINIQHRLVYQVYEEIMVENDVEYQGTIKIIRMWTHYDNIK